MEKPPTQGVGVQGIASAKQGISQPLSVDWSFLGTLPSFQMFVVEKSKGAASEFEQWMPNYIAAQLSQLGVDTFFNEYCHWHEAKGYWPNETPLGQLK